MGLESLKVARWGLVAALFASPAWAEVSTPFTDVLTKNWPAWDADADGTLAEAEINKALKNDAIKGDDAAALAAVKLVHRANKKDLPPLTRAYFQTYAEKAQDKLKAPADESRSADATGVDANGEVVATGDKFYNFDRVYTKAVTRIQRGEGDQWRGVFNRDNMSQGPLGDCFFIASIGSTATHRPELIGQLVQELPNGDFRATFPGGKPFTFKPLTDAQRALSSTTEGDGAWMAVLEMAYGKHRSRLRGGSLDVEGTDVLRTGGDSKVTLEALTGNEVMRIGFTRSMKTKAERKNDTLAKVRTALKTALADNRIITCGILPVKPNEKLDKSDAQAVAGEAIRLADAPPVPKGFQVNHVYAVVSFDEAADTVEIWNPHGQTFDPKGEPGLQNGYVTRNGKFRLPLADAYAIYTSFTFETSKPKTPKDDKEDATAENR